MPKATWGVSDADVFEDDLDDFPIYEGELPPKGVYRCKLKSLRVKENKSGDPMLNGLLEITELRSSKKAQYNGYGIWFNLNVTKQGAPWVNNFLSSLVPEDKVPALRKAFWGEKVMLDKNEPPNVVSIGTVKIQDRDIIVSVNAKHRTYNGDIELDAQRFIYPKDADATEDTPEAEDATEEDWDDADAPAADSDDEAFEEREEELVELTLAELKKVAREDHGMKLADIKKLDKDGLIEAILDAEFPPESDDVEEDDEDETEDDDEDVEEEEEEEPEPPKRSARRTRAAAAEEPAKPATRSRRPAAAAENEAAPTRARTGRRRKAGSDEPPF